MKSDRLNIELEFQEVSEVVTAGILKITSQETIRVNNIRLEVYLEGEGLMERVKQMVAREFIFRTETVLNSNEEYAFPFMLNLHYKTESYNGINGKLKYNCEVKIEVHEDDLGSLDVSLFSTIKSKFMDEKILEYSFFYDYYNHSISYEAKEESYDLKSSLNALAFIPIALIALGFIYFFIPEAGIHIYFIAAILSVMFFQLISSLVSKRKGNNLIKVSQQGNLLQFNLSNCVFYGLREFEIYYEILEKVTDNRGTSTTVHKETLYKSDRKSYDRLLKETLKFSLPENENMQSMNVCNIKIEWIFHVRALNNFGIKKHFFTPFRVKKGERDKSLA